MTQLRTIHERRDGVYHYIREVTIENHYDKADRSERRRRLRHRMEKRRRPLLDQLDIDEDTNE